MCSSKVSTNSIKNYKNWAANMKLLLITLTILQSLLATLEQKTLLSEFTLSISADAAVQPMSYTGELRMHGKQFTLQMLGLEAAYDGQTLYMYSEDSEELTLSTPTEEELVQTNPFLYAQALLPVCQYSEQTVGNHTEATLLPNDLNAGISKFILHIQTTTLLPLSAVIHETDGKTTILQLTHPQYTELPTSFQLEKTDAYVNDLR